MRRREEKDVRMLVSFDDMRGRHDVDMVLLHLYDDAGADSILAFHLRGDLHDTLLHLADVLGP